jgi:hypothetical protein
MSGVIDIDAIARAAGEQVAAKILEKLPELVRVELARRDADRHMDSTELTRYIGLPSTKALNARLGRGSALKAIALNLDGKRVWRKSDVDRLLADGAVPRRAGVSK